MTRRRGIAPNEIAFLIGAGRSGTTLLYKLLCLHPAVGFISNYDERLPWMPAGFLTRIIAKRLNAKVGTWFNQGGNAYFVARPWAKRFFPTPVEGECIYEACGIPLIPSPDYQPDPCTGNCLRRRFARIRRGSGAKVLVSKRTANNRRLPQLDSIFPDAKYVHVVRDGRDVAESLSHVEWWHDHTVWWDGRTAAQMEQAGDHRLAICARNWVEEIGAIRIGLAHVANDRILEMRYERLIMDPFAELEKIIRFLGLPFPTQYRDAVASLNLGPREPARAVRRSPSELAIVLREQQTLLSELGYLVDSESVP